MSNYVLETNEKLGNLNDIEKEQNKLKASMRHEEGNNKDNQYQ